MRTKGKPSCGGYGCNPCEANSNPCLVLTVEDPITIVLDEAPTDYTVEDMEEFLPADLPRDLRYFCVWNSTTGKYECNYHTPGATDTEEAVSLVIADRHGADVAYRSVTYDSQPNNLCDGERWYGGAATQFPTAFRGLTLSTPASCTYAEPDGTSGYCNWGVLPGHVGDMSTGPWTSLGGFPVKWHRVDVGGVLKVRITVGTPNGPGWWGETDFYRAGSTPTAPVFWWPIPSGSPIRLAWTPTVQDDGSAPIDDPLASAETSTFNPWPDILLTSCSNDSVPEPCNDVSCWPPCVIKSCIGSSELVVGDALIVNIDGTDFTLSYNEGSNTWERIGFGDFDITIYCDGTPVPGVYQLLITIDAIFGTEWTGGWLASCTAGVLDPHEFTVDDGMGTEVLIVVHQ